MSLFDDVLSPDDDFDFDNQEVIKIESVEEVMIFDNGFYQEDKAIHILNLLSTNNKHIDLEKFKTYWKIKVENILTETQKENYNINCFPLINCKKKVTEFDPDDSIKMAYRYEDDEIISETVASWVLNRQAIVGKSGTYGSHVDNKCFTLLCPFTNDVGMPLTSSTDCFLNKHTDISRVLGPSKNYQGDLVKITGYVNKINTNTYHEFNVDQYIESLEEINVGDQVEFIKLNKKHKATVLEKTNGGLSLKTRKRNIFFDTLDISSNSFFVYPLDWNKQMISKQDFLKRNIILRGSVDISFLTGDDIIDYVLQEDELITLDSLKSKYHNILDNITNNSEISKYFESMKKIKTHASKNKSKKNAYIAKYNSILKLIQKKNSKTDFKELANKIYSFVKKEKENSIVVKNKKLVAKNEFVYNGEKIFHNVRDMMDDTITSIDKKAYLIFSKNTYKLSKKIYPFDYSIFELKPIKLESQLFWDIVKKIEIENELEQDSSPTNTISQAKEILEKQINAPIDKFYKLVSYPMKYATYRSYTNFQGHDDFENDIIPEFGVKLDVISQDDNIDEDIINEDTNEAVDILIEIVGIKLTPAQKKYIYKTSSMNINVNDKKSILKLINSLFVCVSLFVIFAQISLPDIIIENQLFDTIYSYPINSNDDKFKLLKHLIYKIVNSSSFKTIFANEAISKAFNNISNLKKSIDKLLSEKEFLNLLVKSSEMRVNVHDENFNKLFLLQYPLWASFKPQGQLNEFIEAKEIKKERNILKLNHKGLSLAENLRKHIVQVNANIITEIEATEINLHPLDLIKTNIHMIIKKDSSNDQWNSFSDIVENMAIECQCKDIIDMIKNVDDLRATQILNNILSYEIKDIIGKIAFQYQIHDEKSKPTHIEFLKNKFFTDTLENIDLYKSIAKHIVDSISVPPNLSYHADLKYVFMFILFYILSKFPESSNLYNYIKSIIKKKFYVLTMTKSNAEASYRQNREQRKQQIMQMYKGMDAEIRKLNKQAVDMGLISRQDLVDNVVDKEEIEIRVNNDNDNYDVNEEDD